MPGYAGLSLEILQTNVNVHKPHGDVQPMDAHDKESTKIDFTKVIREFEMFDTHFFLPQFDLPDRKSVV